MTIEERNRKLMARIIAKKDTWKPLTDRQIEERDAEIVRRIEAGETQTAVGEAFGLSRDSIGNICRRAGVNYQSLRKEATRERNQVRDAEIVLRVQAGETTDAVSGAFRLTPRHVNRICRKAGVSAVDIKQEETQARNAEIVRRIQAGETPKNVGKDFGLTNNQVSYICRKAGVRQRNRINDKDQRQRRDAEIVRRVQAGESQAAVARAFGMTRQHTGLICREAGFSKQKEIQARNAEIVRRCRAGERQAAVAMEFGLTPSTVKWICWKARRGAA